MKLWGKPSITAGDAHMGKKKWLLLLNRYLMAELAKLSEQKQHCCTSTLAI